MEGILFKWTNYYNGWQHRYFILNDRGILSYYKSKDLIDQGCKRSCLVSACELKVHPYDSCRFDLIIPGEQFLCLKAKSQCERQQWLVALGTFKCRGNKSNQMSVAAQSSNNVASLNPIDQELKLKLQELRLYETVLMQSIHNIKSLANDSPVIDVQKFDQSTSILNVTCDAFLHTLDECLKLSNGGSSQSLLSLSPLKRNSSNENPTGSTNIPKENSLDTFFSQFSSTFARFIELTMNQIHSELFLSICEQYFSLFEKFASPTFIPLRSEINGNISKIRRKILNDPKKFESLASIVEDEIRSQTIKEKNSATDALLWLKRSLDFLANFLFEFGQADKSIEDALNKAYGISLKPFHGWITRGIFSIAFRSAPYNEDFLLSLLIDSHPKNDSFPKQIFDEMLDHSFHMKNFVKKLTTFFLENQLESNEIIDLIKEMKIARKENSEEKNDRIHHPTRKQRRQLERKLIKAKRNAFHHHQKIPKSIDQLVQSEENEENSSKKKKKKKNKKKTKNDDDDAEELIFDEKAAKEIRRRNLIEDNEKEDSQIKKLEKLLGIKSTRQTYLKGFVDDGLDFLLDFCDQKKRKEILQVEGDGERNAWEEEDLDEDQLWLKRKQKETIEKINQKEKEEKKITKEKTSKVKFNEEIQTKLIDEEEEETTSVLQEDIYGRTIDKKGNVVETNSKKKYLPPALRQNLSSAEENSLNELKRRLQGQLNRLSEKNFSSILNEIENLYRSESRAMINRCLFQLSNDLLLSTLSLTNENLISEFALLMSLLHVNIGLEIGSFFLENFLEKFVEHLNDEVSNKFSDNLIRYLSYFYAFYMMNDKVLFDLGRLIFNSSSEMTEKRLELILLLLRTVGFLLRKENPLELKSFLQQVRTIPSSSSTRFQYLIETIQSLKNNDVRKLPGAFDPERIDRLRKIYRNLIKDKNNQQINILNVGLEDFLQAKERGRWWIVGSAWQKSNPQTQNSPQQFDEKILQLAREQHINTDIRRIIFATLLTSQDCDDAVEKLHKLNLNKIQEREIIHMIIHCCLHEKTSNPYYTLVLQRFCSYDRRFQMTLQYDIWDRFKQISSFNDQQLTNLGSMVAQLLLSKSATLNLFKNFNFVELTTSTRTFLLQLFVEVFNEIDERSLRNLFEMPKKSTWKFLQEALKLFLSHFILKKSNFSDLIHRRCQIAIDQLSID